MRDAGRDDGEVEEVTRGLEKFSLASIIPNSEDVRVTNIEGVPHIWAVDLSMAITGKDRRHANECLTNLSCEMFEAGKFVLKNLPGNGKWPVKLLTLPHAIELVLVLPGAAARALRTKASNLMVRFLGGDPTLIREIEDNAASTAPINTIARASIDPVPPAAVVTSTAKRARIEVDYTELERRRNFICDSYERYQQCTGGDIATEVRQEYNKAMLEIFRCANPSSSIIEKPRLKNGFVYCFQSNQHPDEVKIGCTTNVKLRLYQVNKQYKDRSIDIVLSYRYSVRTLDAEGDEKLAHAHFASVRLPGPGELFRTTPESVLDFFDTVIKPRYVKDAGDIDGGDVTDMDMDADDVDDMDMDVGAEEAVVMPIPNPVVVAVPMPTPMPPPMPMPMSMPRALCQLKPMGVIEVALKAFVLEHLMYQPGSFVLSRELREVFLRHSGFESGLFSKKGYGPYSLLSTWLNCANDSNTVLIEHVKLKKQHYVPFLKKNAHGYENLAWKDGPIADVVRAVRSQIS